MHRCVARYHIIVVLCQSIYKATDPFVYNEEITVLKYTQFNVLCVGCACVPTIWSVCKNRFHLKRLLGKGQALHEVRPTASATTGHLHV